jgi:hypothetical protein
VSQTPVLEHHVTRLELANGRTLLVSGGHPTADGRLFSELRAGSQLDGVLVVSTRSVPYEHAATHDILPASKNGAYYAAGVLIGSTLR